MKFLKSFRTYESITKGMTKMIEDLKDLSSSKHSEIVYCEQIITDAEKEILKADNAVKNLENIFTA